MLPTRLLPPQFLLPSWSARQLSLVLRRNSSSSYNFRPLLEEKKIPERPGGRKQTSLFGELFPEENDESRVEDSSLETAFEKLPPFRWLDPPKKETPAAPNPKTPLEQASEGLERRGSNVLVLHRVSKTLEKSDFFRLSFKGKHIEGWTSGITKVIQARDPITLAPLGSYLLVFSSPGSCDAYLHEINRLHMLSRLQAKAAVTGSLLPPPKHLVNEGEDLEATLRGFTLLPAHDETTLKRLEAPFSPEISQYIKDGGPPILASLKNKAGEMVLFTAEEGGIDEHVLRDALNADGKWRNLPWKLTVGDQGIMKLSGSFAAESLGEGSEEYGETGISVASRRRSFPTPSRYILSFEDRNEARRFVREWHRREFPTERQSHPGDDPPPIITAEVVW